jgi:hypothetical protein
MAEAHVISALIERRARLAGELRAKQAEVRQMKSALASIDLCIRMFKGDHQPESIAPKVTFGKNPALLPKGSGSRRKWSRWNGAISVCGSAPLPSGRACTSGILARVRVYRRRSDHRSYCTSFPEHHCSAPTERWSSGREGDDEC